MVSGVEKTNLDVTKTLLKMLEKDEAYIEYVEHRLGHDFRYAIDDSKLRALGWKPEVDFDDGLKKTIEYHGY